MGSTMRGRPVRWTRCPEAACSRILLAMPKDLGGYRYAFHWTGGKPCPLSGQPIPDRFVYPSQAEVPKL